MKDSTRKSKSFLSNIAGFFSLFYYWLGPVSFIVYPYAIFKTKWSFPNKDWFMIFSISFLFIFSCFNIGILESMEVYRFHWGFLFFYFFFRSTNQFFNVNQLFFIMLALIYFEVILVNTFVDPGMLPNYPDKDVSPAHFSDTWQRPYSFGGNSAVTSVLLISLLPLLNPGYFLLFLSGVTTVVIGSGSGMAAFLLYFFYRLRGLKAFILILISIYLWLIIAPLIPILYKVSPGYLAYLFELKFSQIHEVYINFSIFDKVMGKSVDKGGDFLWLHFLKIHGYVGGLLISFFFLTHINKINFVSIFIIIFFSAHYFVLFSLPGQLIVGYLLALNNQKSNFNNAVS